MPHEVTKFDDTDERLSRLEGAYEQVDRRLDDMNRALDSLRLDMSSFRNEMNSRVNNLYVLFFGGWVTIMVAIIGLYLKG